MRAVATVVTIVILLGLLIAAVWFAYSGLIVEGAPMSGHGYAAMAIGVILSLIVGVGLMALLFYSSRHGYDEPPHYRDNPPR